MTTDGLGRPGYPVPPRPRRSGVDVAISIVTLLLTVVFGAAAAFFGLFSLAFLDHCPPATCSVEGAVNAVFTSLLAAAGIGLVGVVVTVIQLIRRKLAWPFAVGTFTLCAAAVLLGVVGYSAAVG
ncbi:hypothetical protein [Mycolicibacterium iranicum]|uniref:Uncharacterized protein n=1 Tax=Mycolicibacterium iranicum TaxID=912594 RepID=A0A178LUD1_MYCIR|nr:hypothetical protein [Mycolicibacterium iranicum]OAN37569.1 hypothetical protein A4X20_21765 [Mycolicibacterium iranicum]